MALVQIDVLEPEPRERGVDLLEDLLARKPAVAVRHRATDLCRDDERVARTAPER